MATLHWLIDFMIERWIPFLRTWRDFKLECRLFERIKVENILKIVRIQNGEINVLACI